MPFGVAGGDPPGERDRGADGRMAGERQLARGVKMRMRALWTGLTAGRTKTVSERLNSRAIACMRAVVELRRIEDDGKRIAGERPVGKDVEDGVAARQGSPRPERRRLSRGPPRASRHDAHGRPRLRPFGDPGSVHRHMAILASLAGRSPRRRVRRNTGSASGDRHWDQP